MVNVRDKKIAFIHPDLGIGGAERLVVDAAVGLQNLGASITIYTSYCDKSHCFDEIRDGTLKVKVLGDSLVPANIFGRFAILCAMLRQLHLVYALLKSHDQFDAIFIDQLSVGIPWLRYFRPRAPILFYCHFPDKLLSVRNSFLKTVYRIPFDFIEGWTTNQADLILVNSNFTASIFKDAFPLISRTPRVLYPCVDVKQQFQKDAILNREKRRIVLSINRFEQKKDVDLAILAYGRLRELSRFTNTVLIIAGGYDNRVKENVSCHQSLSSLCRRKNLTSTTISSYSLPFEIRPEIQVYFLLSIPSILKQSLLACSALLVYTPKHEHFGIVPIEASLAGLPVLAQDNGGPLETVEDGVTGFLRPADPSLWSTVIEDVCLSMSSDRLKSMGEKGREKVLQTFSQETMAQKLATEFTDIMSRRRSVSRRLITTCSVTILAALCFVILSYTLLYLL